MVFNAALKNILGPSWPWSGGSWIANYLSNLCLSPLMLWNRLPPRARCTTLCDKNWQWLAVGRWFSPISSTNKTDRHDLTEILLGESGVKHNKTNQPSYIVAVSFIGGGNRSSRGKPPNCHKTLTNLIT
jgi:hypothetical protein